MRPVPRAGAAAVMKQSRKPNVPKRAGRPLPPAVARELSELVRACAPGCADALDISLQEVTWPIGGPARAATDGGGAGAGAGGGGVDATAGKQRWLQVRGGRFLRAPVLYAPAAAGLHPRRRPFASHYSPARQPPAPAGCKSVLPALTRAGGAPDQPTKDSPPTLKLPAPTL